MVTFPRRKFTYLSYNYKETSKWTGGTPTEEKTN